MQSLNGDPLCSLHTAEQHQDDANNSPLVVIFGIIRICTQNPLAGNKQCTRPWTFQKYPRIEPSSDKFQIFTFSAIQLSECLSECRKKSVPTVNIYLFELFCQSCLRKCHLFECPEEVSTVTSITPECAWFAQILSSGSRLGHIRIQLLPRHSIFKKMYSNPFAFHRTN